MKWTVMVAGVLGLFWVHEIQGEEVEVEEKDREAKVENGEEESSGSETAQATFFKIYMLTQEAEDMEQHGDREGALEHYQKIEGKLKVLKENHPRWEKSVVTYRLKRVGDIIAELEYRLASSQREKRSQVKVIQDGSLKSGMRLPLIVTTEEGVEASGIPDLVSDEGVEGGVSLNEDGVVINLQEQEVIRDEAGEFDGSENIFQEEIRSFEPMSAEVFDSAIRMLSSEFHEALTQLELAKDKEKDLVQTIGVLKRENKMLANQYADTAREVQGLKEREGVLRSENRVLAEQNRSLNGKVEVITDENRVLGNQNQQLTKSLQVVRDENTMLAKGYAEESAKAKQYQVVASGTVMNLERLRMRIGSLRSLMHLRKESLRALRKKESLKHDAATQDFLKRLETISEESEELLKGLETQRKIMELNPDSVEVSAR